MIKERHIKKDSSSKKTDRKVQPKPEDFLFEIDKPSADQTTHKRSRQTHSPSDRKRMHRPDKQEAAEPARKDMLRIIPLGGCEEVGRNMTIFEYNREIVILDMGIQFPEEDMPGIDYIIPNTRYLAGREKDIKGVIFSHGHLDHIGAAPILLEKLNYPLVLGKELTLALVKHRLEDYRKDSTKFLKTMTIRSFNDVVKLGKFTIKFFQVEHSIMDAMGVIIESPAGTVVHPGDWTLERDKQGQPTIDYSHLSKLPRPTVLMMESLGVIHEQEKGNYEDMYNNLRSIITQSTGRVIIGTFASQIERTKWIIETAQQLGKKIALDGYSMKMNIDIAKKLGYIKFKPDTIVDIRHINDYPDHKVIIVCTGAQGEENAVLSRIVTRSHRFIQLKKNDTVVFSSSVIPGNERTIQRLKDNIYRQADNVIHSEVMDVHVSGHATRKDILDVLDMVKPDYFIPVYANHYMLKEAAMLAAGHGFKKDNIFVPDNGSVIEISKFKAEILKRKVPSDYVFVDGLGISDMQNVVLRDRQLLAADGMVVVIATVETHTGQLVQNPDIISRGFVFLKENKKLIEDLRHRVKKMVMDSDPLTWADTNQIKNTIREKVGQFLFSKTQKRPMVLPVVIEV